MAFSKLIISSIKENPEPLLTLIRSENNLTTETLLHIELKKKIHNVHEDTQFLIIYYIHERPLSTVFQATMKNCIPINR